MEKRINYVGWVTPNNNLGDEALYRINQDIFSKYNFKLLRITDPRRQKHSQTTIVSGGTCLPSIAMYMRPTKYAYVFGTGVLDPLFYGPFDPELIDRFKLLHFRFIGVRGNISKARLRGWGIDSEVIGDLGLSLKPTKVSEKRNKIAINIGAGDPKFSWKGDRLLIELSKVCKVLKAEGYELVLIPFWKNNMEDVENLSKQADVDIFEKWLDIEATMNLISTCKIFIGEKLHSLVFSAAANTPFIGLAYSPEHFDFADSVGFSEFTMPITEITAEKIIAMFHDLINNYEKIQDKLAGCVNEYREKQREFATRISSDLESLPEDKWAIQNNFRNTLVQRVDMLFYSKMGKIWKVWDRLVYSRLRRYLI
ncbi:polysaccharide pyruvyl transferase family protein [Candidatus Bathyarchaeota archaeon]|nr:polysaccharide pyruvyl transferase family protein [Candidatus Bathyarchaeota archaeon]